MDTTPPYPPRYVMLNDDQKENLRPPPGSRRNIPLYHSDHHHHSGRSSRRCFKCICCFCCCLTSLIVFFFLVAFAVYSLYTPELPSYKVDSFNVSAFDVTKDFSLYAEFSVTVKAKNPNAHIGIRYEKNSSVVILYRDRPLCSGKLPVFYQPGNNLSHLKVVLKGKNEIGSQLEALVKNQNSKGIPLDIRIKAPVSIFLGEFPLRKVYVLVNCSLVVDKLSAKTKIKILSSDYKYKFKM